MRHGANLGADVDVPPRAPIADPSPGAEQVATCDGITVCARIADEMDGACSPPD
jgi:hypothetical protein